MTAKDLESRTNPNCTPCGVIYHLLLCLLPLLAISDPVFAQPAGELLDARLLASDEALICSSYLNANTVETALSRADGQKHLKKPFWTLRLAKRKISALNQTIKKLKLSSSADSVKKLKKAKADKKALVLAKAQLAECGISHDSSSPVQFRHVSALIQNRCMNCHGVLGWTNDENFFLDTGLVVRGSLEASPFYVFLSNNPEGYLPAYMPKGVAPLSDLNIMLIARWIQGLANPQDPNRTPGPSPTATPGGNVGDGRALYATYCASCHGAIDVSAKWGRTEAQIRAALGGGVPQMAHLNLSDEQIQRIALALAAVLPPQEGTLTVSNVASVSEGNPGDVQRFMQFDITLSGTVSQPFTVGYVTSNGSALGDSDFRFAAGTVQFQGSEGERHSVNVEILSDTFQETDESLFVDIGGVSYGGVRINTSTASGTIVNDDIFTQNIPPQAGKLRMAYGFNGDYLDELALSNAQAQGDTVFLTPGKVGSGALELDEGSDHLLLPGGNLQALTDFTFASWVFWQNSTSTTSRIFDFGSSTTNYIYFSPKDTANRCRFELRTASGTFTLQCATGVSLPANRWVHVAVTFNSATDEMKIYFDGSQMATRAGVTLALSTLTASDNKIGKSRVTTNVDFGGRLDESTVWDAALAVDEIAQMLAMGDSISLNPGIEVRLNNQPLANGSSLNLGSVAVGSHSDLSLVINNNGLAGLALTGTPIIQFAGRNSSEFSAQYQPWPWQQLLGVGSLTTFSLRYGPTAPGDKIATLIIPNSDSINGNFALGLQGQATGVALPQPTPPATGDNPLIQGQYLYTVNCSSCHGILGQSQKQGATVQDVTAALDPVTGVPQMRSLGLTAEQIDLIVLALNSPPPQSDTSNKVGDSIVNIGTAPFVASVFSTIFLPEDPATFVADDVTIATRISEGILGRRANGTFIPGRVGTFGGRCDRFDDVCQAEAMAASHRPAPSAVRSGLVIRTCAEVLTFDRAVQNALAKIQRSTTSTLDATATSAIYQMFYPGRDLPQYLAEVIATFSRGLLQLNQTDHWRFQLNLICASTEWENL